MNKRKAKAARKGEDLTDENIDILNKIKRVLELLKSTNTIKLAPVRILQEEGKEGQIVCKSRPRRRSTLKKSKLNELRKHPDVITQRRRSRRIQENLIKRNSREFIPSAFVTAPKDNEFKDRLSTGKFESQLGSTLDQVPKQGIAESPLNFKPEIFGEEKKEEILTDNE